LFTLKILLYSANNFFKLCTFDYGRFLHPDSLTAAKEKLDYPRVLRATPALEVIKRVETLLVDGTLVGIQIIEEWGYDLGDDACLFERDTVSRASLVANDDFHGDLEASNLVDMLVDQLANGMGEEECVGTHKQNPIISPAAEAQKKEERRPRGPINIVLEPVVDSTTIASESSSSSVVRVAETLEPLQGLGSLDPAVSGKSVDLSKSYVPSKGVGRTALCPPGRKRTLSCPSGARASVRSGPWSFERLHDCNIRDAGVIFSPKKRDKKGSVAGGSRHKEVRPSLSKKSAGGLLRHPCYSLKRVAKLPSNERQEVLSILKKSSKRRKTRGFANQYSAMVQHEFSDSDTTSSSINNEWKYWVVMQGNDHIVEDTVMEMGKFMGATFTSDNANTFSVLSRACKGKHASLGPTQCGRASSVTGC
jgi:hypothetical protein